MPNDVFLSGSMFEHELPNVLEYLRICSQDLPFLKVFLLTYRNDPAIFGDIHGVKCSTLFVHWKVKRSTLRNPKDLPLWDFFWDFLTSKAHDGSMGLVYYGKNVSPMDPSWVTACLFFVSKKCQPKNLGRCPFQTSGSLAFTGTGFDLGSVAPTLRRAWRKSCRFFKGKPSFEKPIRFVEIYRKFVWEKIWDVNIFQPISRKKSGRRWCEPLQTNDLWDSTAPKAVSYETNPCWIWYGGICPKRALKSVGFGLKCREMNDF